MLFGTEFSFRLFDITIMIQISLLPGYMVSFVIMTSSITLVSLGYLERVFFARA